MADDVIKFTVFGKDEYTKTLTGFKNVASKVAGGLKLMAKGSAVLTTAISALTIKTAASIDQQVKFASRVGRSIVAMSRYSHAADLAGLTNQNFSLSVQRMTRRVSEAAKGMGEAKGALNELNIDAKTFQGLTLDKQLETLSERMDGLSNESDKLRLAFKLFDTEGTAMVQLLGQGSEAMKAAAADADFLGLTISESLARKSEELTDSFTRFKGSMKGVANGLTGLLAPALTETFNNMANFIARWRESLLGFVRSTMTTVFTVVEVFKQMGEALSRQNSIAKVLEMMIRNIIEAAPFIAATMFELVKGMGKAFIAGAKALLLTAFDFGFNIGQAIRSGFTGGGFDFAAEMSKSLVSRFEEAKNSIGDIAGEMSDNIKPAFSEIGNLIGETFGVNLDTARANAEAAIESMVAFGASAAEQITNSSVLVSETMAVFREQYNAFREEIELNTQTFFETLFTTAKQTIDAVSNAMAQAIVSGQGLTDAFKRIASQVLTSVVQALIKMGIQRLLLAKINAVSAKTEATAEASKAVAMAGANGVASWAAAPWPINAGAPAFGAAMIGAASGAFSAGAATGAALGAGVGGIAHGGLTNVPAESTYLLQRGERVLSPNQNRDFTDFIGSGGGGSAGTVVIENLNIEVLPNATNAEAFFDMDRDELTAVLVDPVINALNEADSLGKRPEFVERGNSI